MRIPLIQSVETAIRVFYAYPQLGNKQIRELFGHISDVRCVGLKRIAFDLMKERGIMRYNDVVVNTDVAYEAWGLDIAELEKRLKKTRQFGLNGEAEKS